MRRLLGDPEIKGNRKLLNFTDQPLKISVFRFMQVIVRVPATLIAYLIA